MRRLGASAYWSATFSPEVPLVRIAATKEVVQIADIRTEQSYIERDPEFSELVELGGGRTLLLVPMLKEDELVGAFTIYRQEVRPFTDKQIELVRTSPPRPSSPSRMRGC